MKICMAHHQNCDWEMGWLDRLADPGKNKCGKRMKWNEWMN